MIGLDMPQLEGQTSAGVTILKIEFLRAKKVARKLRMTINAFGSNIFGLFLLNLLDQLRDNIKLINKGWRQVRATTRPSSGKGSSK